jgi:hypothetical protein
MAMTEIDPKLSRVYREASSENPPAAVDAAILAAARQRAAGAGRRERSQSNGRSRSFWSRWMVPASVAATLALGVSIALLVEREHPEIVDDTAIRPAPPQPQGSPRAPAAESSKAKAADSAGLGAPSKKEAPAVAAPPQSTEAVSPAPNAPQQSPAAPPPASIAPTQAPAGTSPAPNAPTQAPAVTLRAPARAQVPRPAEPAPSAAEAFPADSRAKASAPKAAATKAEAAKEAAPNAAAESNATSDSATGGLGASAPAGPAATAKPAPLRQQAIQRSAEEWLDEISRLKRDGREKEAADQLAEFRKAYPAHPVPQSLQNLR